MTTHDYWLAETDEWPAPHLPRHKHLYSEVLETITPEVAPKHRAEVAA